MPTVRMLTSVVDGDEVFDPTDGPIEIAGERASAWLAAGMCELVRGQTPETPEGRVQRPARGRPSGPERR